MAVSFYEEPELDLDIQLDMLKHGFTLNKLPAGLAPMLQSKLREMLVEKFVYPNRKYVRLPGTPKKEPPRPVTEFKVNSVLPEEFLESTSENSTDSTSSKPGDVYANPELQNMVIKKKELKGKDQAKSASLSTSNLRSPAPYALPTAVQAAAMSSPASSPKSRSSADEFHANSETESTRSSSSSDEEVSSKDKLKKKTNKILKKGSKSKPMRFGTKRESKGVHLSTLKHSERHVVPAVSEEGEADESFFEEEEVAKSRESMEESEKQIFDYTTWERSELEESLNKQESEQLQDSRSQLNLDLDLEQQVEFHVEQEGGKIEMQLVAPVTASAPPLPSASMLIPTSLRHPTSTLSLSPASQVNVSHSPGSSPSSSAKHDSKHIGKRQQFKDKLKEKRSSMYAMFGVSDIPTDSK